MPFHQNAQFGPLEETYGILSKFDVSVTEEEQKMLADLEQAGEDFKIMLKEVEQARPMILCTSGRACINLRG